MIRAVLFDAVGTLIHPSPPATEVYAQYGARYGSRRTAQEIGPRLRAALQLPSREPLWPRVDRDLWHTSEHHEWQRWRRIVANVLDDVPDLESLFNDLWGHFAVPLHWSLFPEVPRVWGKMVTKYVLGVASNFDQRLREVCRGLPPLDCCPNVFCSSCLGFAKPDVRFFQAVGEQLGLAPEQILMVGDDPFQDAGGARAAGWQYVLVDRARTSASSTTRVVASLEELSCWLAI